MAKPTSLPWEIEALAKPPKTFAAPGFEPMGSKALFYDKIMTTPELKAVDSTNNRVKAVFFEGLPLDGKPTRVFAYYGVPDLPKGRKAPGIVLCHGGGGTAFESWVRLWNARGYAAIAMDTCGCVPKGEYAKWDRHEYGGPAGWGGFNQISAPPQNQWSYHAVADVVLAHSLLRSFPEVDPDRIGITGISWGGYLTCIASSVDKRFRFAAPVYGCGFLGENSKWLDIFERMGKEDSGKWLDLWDPSRYLGQSTAATLWVTGTNDLAYPMDSLQKSYRLPKGPRMLCIRVRMPHHHGGIGETAPEIEAFADFHCTEGEAMIQVTKQGRSADQVWVTCGVDTKPVSAELNYTLDTGDWHDREWKTVPAVVADGGRITANLPKGARVYYFNLLDSRGLIVSSEHVEVN